MGFLKNVFKRKEGGTFFGNIIRTVAKTYTGGILGSGAQMKQPSQPQGEMLQQAIAQSPLPAVEQPVSPMVQPINNFLKQATSGVQVGVQAGIDDKTKYYIGGGALALVLVILLMRNNK